MTTTDGASTTQSSITTSSNDTAIPSATYLSDTTTNDTSTLPSSLNNISSETTQSAANSVVISDDDTSLTPTIWLTIFLLVAAAVVMGVFVMYRTFRLLRTRRRDFQVCPTVTKSKEANRIKSDPGGQERKYGALEENAAENSDPQPETSRTVRAEVMKKYTNYRTERVTDKDFQRVQRHMEVLQNMPPLSL